jgi:hypothetical protein
MLRRVFTLTLVMLLGVAWVSAMGFGDQPRSKKRRAARNQAMLPAAEPQQAEPKLPVPGHDPFRLPPGYQNRPKVHLLHVYPNPAAQGAMRELHEQAARLIAAANNDQAAQQAGMALPAAHAAGGPPTGHAAGGRMGGPAALIAAADMSSYRKSQFGWVKQREGHEITGWGATVQEVTEAGGVYHVTLRVTPHVTVHGSSGTVLSDYVLEKYMITQGQVHFVQGIHPPDAHPGAILTD